MCSRFSGSYENPDNSTRSNNSLTEPAEIILLNIPKNTHLQLHPRRIILAPNCYFRRFFSPQCHYFQANLSHLACMTSFSFPNLFFQHLSCMLFRWPQFAKTEKALCLICLVILSHSSGTLLVLLAPLPLFYSSSLHISAEGFFTYKTQPHSWAGLDMSGGWSRATLSNWPQCFIPQYFIPGTWGFFSIHSKCAERKATNSFILLFLRKIKKFCLFFTLENNKSSGDDALLWHIPWFPCRLESAGTAGFPRTYVQIFKNSKHQG